MTTASACVPAGTAWLKIALIWTSTIEDFNFSLCLVTSNTKRGYSDLKFAGEMFDLVINSSIPKYLIPNKDASPYALLNCWLANERLWSTAGYLVEFIITYMFFKFTWSKIAGFCVWSPIFPVWSPITIHRGFSGEFFYSQSPSKSCYLMNRYSVALPRSIRYRQRNFGFYFLIDWKLFRVDWKHVWHKPSNFIDCYFYSIDGISTKYRIVVRLTNQC